MKADSSQTNPGIEPVQLPESDLEPLYRVYIHNDDVTPMDFVVLALERFFQVNGPKAEEIMLTAHNHGSAYVQTLPKAEGQNRINRAHFAAALEGYPLLFSMEQE